MNIVDLLNDWDQFFVKCTNLSSVSVLEINEDVSVITSVKRAIEKLLFDSITSNKANELAVFPKTVTELGQTAFGRK